VNKNQVTLDAGEKLAQAKRQETTSALAGDLASGVLSCITSLIQGSGRSAEIYDILTEAFHSYWSGRGSGMQDRP